MIKLVSGLDLLLNSFVLFTHFFSIVDHSFDFVLGQAALLVGNGYFFSMVGAFLDC
jgi:hypothetical protein